MRQGRGGKAQMNKIAQTGPSLPQDRLDPSNSVIGNGGGEMPPQAPGTLLANEIMTRRQKRLESKISSWPRRNVIASDIPICTRQGVYAITQWDQRKMHDANLQARFEKGNQEEANLIRELGELGFQVIEQQVPLDKGMTDKYGISGKIDGKIKWENARIPFEIKSMNPYSFKKVNSIEDMKNDTFMSRYIRQMTVYLLGHNEPWGLFLLTDCMGHWKVVPIELDYEEGERILKKIEEINSHLKAGTLADRIPYDKEICGFCSFAHICLPDVMNVAKVQWQDKPELEQSLNRRAELEPAKKEFEKLDEEIKESFREVELAVVGTWIVSGKWQDRKSYAVPEDVKKPYQKTTKAWVVKIANQKQESLDDNDTKK